MAHETSPSGTPTPEKVKQLATEEARLDQIALLGIFGARKAPRALIRTATGATRTVSLGDHIKGAKIIAIGQDQLVLSRPHGQEIMHLPRG
ncbi:MAG: pilus assembly protein PilZ [Sulfitobacter sp.]